MKTIDNLISIRFDPSAGVLLKKLTLIKYIIMLLVVLSKGCYCGNAVLITRTMYLYVIDISDR